MSFRVQEQHLSLHFVLPLYTYSDHLLFGFYAISYNIFFSPLPLATSSFHRHVSLCFGGPIVHPRTCSVAFCIKSKWNAMKEVCLFHCIPFTFYIVSFKYLIFSLCYQPSKFWSLGSLSFHTFSLSVCIITGRMTRSGKLPVLNLLTGQKIMYSPLRATR